MTARRSPVRDAATTPRSITRKVAERSEYRHLSQVTQAPYPSSVAECAVCRQTSEVGAECGIGRGDTPCRALASRPVAIPLARICAGGNPVPYRPELVWGFWCQEIFVGISSISTFSSFFVSLESRFSAPACILKVSRAERQSTVGSTAQHLVRMGFTDLIVHYGFHGLLKAV